MGVIEERILPSSNAVLSWWTLSRTCLDASSRLVRPHQHIWHVSMPPKLDGLLHTAGATKSPIELVHIAKRYAADLPPRPSSLRPRDSHKDVVLVTGTTGNFGCDLLESMLRDESVAFVYALNRHNSNAPERQTSAFLARGFDIALLASSRYRLVEGDLNARGFGLDPSLLDEVHLFCRNISLNHLTQTLNRSEVQSRASYIMVKDAHSQRHHKHN